MNTNNRFPAITEHLSRLGVTFFTDIREEGKGAAIANTFVIEVDGTRYVIDPACGKRRRSQLRAGLPAGHYDLLVTHSHLDHSANSGAVVRAGTRVWFHPLVAGRITNLIRNYTEITDAMVAAFGVRGFFGRTRMLGPRMIAVVLFIQERLPWLFRRVLRLTSRLMCRMIVGSIYAPVKHARYLDEADRRPWAFGGVTFTGWRISEHLYALETPGHQQDHLSFYVSDRKIMFGGDLVNFLNPNDILEGSIRDTHDGMMKMLALAEAGGIEVLAVSHQLPMIGRDAAITYLGSVIARQDEILDIVAAVVGSCDDPADFEEVIAEIYRHEAELMKRVLKINYPRSVSFIDVYVLIYLREYGTVRQLASAPPAN